MALERERIAALKREETPQKQEVTNPTTTNTPDIIMLKSGQEIKAKVTEITLSEIKYKQFEYLEGPTRTVSKSDVFVIIYENGTIGGFSACKKRDTINVYATEEGRIDINEDEFVRKYFAPNCVSINSPMKLIIENRTKKVMTYGIPFSLEYFDKNSWNSIRLNFMWEDLFMSLQDGETAEKEMYLYSLIKEVNKGKKGKYRIIRKYSFYIDFPTEIDSILNNVSLYAEFEIK